MLVFKAVVDTNHLRILLVVAKDITVEKNKILWHFCSTGFASPA
jgi:hypothetical protein